MKKQITYLLFTLLFALTSSQVMAQKNVLYILAEGVKIYNDNQVAGAGYGTNAPDTSYGIVTKSSLLYNDPVSRMLKADPNFNVVTIIAQNGAGSPASYVVALNGTVPAGNSMAVATGIDQTGFDLIIVTENVATYNFMKASEGGALTPANIQAPIIYSKMLHFRNNNTIASASAAVTKTLNLSMSVVDASSPLFTGLGLSNGDDIPLFLTTSDDYGQAGGNRSIDVANSVEITSDGATPITNTLLATVPEITTPDQAIGINYFPANTHLGTDATGVLAHDAIALPFSWGASVKQDGGNITSQYLTIWRNAAYMLTGLANPGGLVANPSASAYEMVTATYYHDFRGGDASSFLGNVTTPGTPLASISRISNVDGFTELNVVNATTSAQSRFKSDGDNILSPSIDYVSVRYIEDSGDNFYDATLGLQLKVGSEVHIKTLSGGKVTVPLMPESTLDYNVSAPNFNNGARAGVVDGTSLTGPSTVTYNQDIDGARADDFTFEYYGNAGGIDFNFKVIADGAGTDMYLPYIQVDFNLLQKIPQEIAYVQASAYAGTEAEGASSYTNDPIVRMFNADPNFNITVLTVDNDGTGLDLTGYDMVIAQETFTSTANIYKPTGPLGIKNLSIPVIYNKSWALRSGRAVTDADATMAISPATTLTVNPANQANPLFSGISYIGNDFMLYNETSDNNGGTGTNSIDVLNELDLSVTGTLLGTNPNVTVVDKAIVVNDIPGGTKFGTGTDDILPLTSRMIAFSFNYGAIIKGDGANITSEALTLWRNAAYILTGQSVPPNLYVNPDYVTLSIDKVGETSAVSSNVKAIGNRIYVSNVKSATEVNIYSITGALVKTIKTNEDTDFNFKTGIWIATVKTFEGAKAVKLLTR
ncbi:hypothetical protein CJ739_3356 [Mariniflexile rhizosphaerae]|uniref:hypothetical protein n=1 Tax=unclassified Mariniflexile TaxID=2643887 RepID=UPI000CABB1EF|nr:hypothetical protein [Mariniflexile sp. TRM1-10]AXP82418.1 hypothetical protein CJ739_3356 [Mariniflexile sp. TRM1-10]PLB18358.1 MAG: Pectin methylesterase [Flavobacteriaceae bacterium FS1-H7996/R]